jgi:phosphoribosylanthranilate isomerase
MTEIKICGITNIEDAIHATESGADALGFIFHPASPRFVTPQKAREIIQALPQNIARVGVFVNRDIMEVKWTADYCELDFLQLHGDETPEYCRNFPVQMLIKVVFPRDEIDVESLNLYPVKAFLADSGNAAHRGGIGETTDWKESKKIARVVPLILAGGLHTGNIEAAIETVSPVAVDICSGVEAWPGKKDHEKIRAIIDIIRALKKDGVVKIFGNIKHGSLRSQG